MTDIAPTAGNNGGTTDRFRVRNWDRASFPAIYRAADDASRRAQRFYVRLVLLDLGLMVTGAILSTLGLSGTQDKQVALWAAAATFVLGLAVTALLAVKRWDKVWFSARSVAESVKSLAWKFVCCADPFPVGMVEAKATGRLLDMLEELLRNHRDLQPHLVGQNILDDHATDWMKRLRKAAPQVRRDVYLAQRVNEQQAWYANGATRNRRMQGRWFIAFILVQAAAVTFAVLAATHAHWNAQPSGAFAALATAIVGWGQVRRFQELTQAYGQAAIELGFISERSRETHTEKDLSRFVADAETAISREHTAWVARRETA